MTSLSNLVRGIAIAAVFSLAAAAQPPLPDAVARAKQSFIDRMVEKHDFDRAELTSLLDAAVIDNVVLETMARPAERVVPWFEYRNIFITEERIAAGVVFWNEHAETLDAVSERYGVAPEMIVSIIGIETYFGTRMGRYRVLDALATLAFAYPPRASFFSSELEAFLLLAREEQVDVTTALGSYAGAMGAGQFIPSSYRAYAVDANADGKRDLWSDWHDVFGSVANYFDKHGWRAGEPVMESALRPVGFEGPEPRNALELGETVGSLTRMGYVFTTSLPSDAPAQAFSYEAESGGSEYWVGYHNFRVVTRYNRSTKYALAAHQLAQAVRGRYTATFASNVGSTGE
ncbi:MAG TPA: lytic murein transglycosylase B [Gammaproteobacteria bacterium]|nr:lytic murein transglycosylase B [Gammaproteobacteria bacterium]